MTAQDELFDMTTTTQLFDYGQEVEIDIPSADERAPAPGAQTAYAVCFDQMAPG